VKAIWFCGVFWTLPSAGASKQSALHWCKSNVRRTAGKEYAGPSIINEIIYLHPVVLKLARHAKLLSLVDRLIGAKY
jgi:hypothetical protein